MCKKLEKQEVKENLNDFDRFKVMVYKKQVIISY